MTDDTKRVVKWLKGQQTIFDATGHKRDTRPGEAAALIERLKQERDEARQAARKAWLSGAQYQERAEAAEAREAEPKSEPKECLTERLRAGSPRGTGAEEYARPILPGDLPDDTKRMQYQLHTWALTGGAGDWRPGLLREAAALIERLEAKNAKLREALREARPFVTGNGEAELFGDPYIAEFLAGIDALLEVK